MQPKEPLRGGKLLAEISTTIVAILREHYGRGPIKAKTYALDDIIVCVMRGSGFTALERTIMAKRYCTAIEELTERNVVAFLSQAHVDPDITIELFFVDGPLEGFGAWR